MVLAERTDRGMGAIVKYFRSLLLLSMILCCGCTPSHEEIPYVRLESGELATQNVVFTLQGTRERTAQDVQPLYFIADGEDYELEQSAVLQYTGTLYALSNYRELLLKRGYKEDAFIQTAAILDTTLYNEQERVRLIYQSTGTIRILFDNPEGDAHILLREMR